MKRNSKEQGAESRVRESFGGGERGAQDLK